MKIAVIKLGSRVSVSNTGTSGGTGETLSIIKILTTAGADVDVYTKVLSTDESPSDFKIFDLETTYLDINNKGYDCLLVLNGNINYFGGKDNPAQTLNYYIINHFNGKVFYIMCDCNLVLKQIWHTISRKGWAYKEEDISIIRDDIVYITQARDTKKVLEKARQYVPVKDAVYFPFEKFPLLTMSDMEFNSNPTYDLLYGGTFRGGKREADMIKYYFNIPIDLKVEMFGKIKLEDFNSKKVDILTPPNFGKSVDYDKFCDKMHDAAATVIIGDPLYKEWDDLAQRIYESIRSGNVVLLDSSYDFSKRVFSNEELKSFCYVNSRNDVIDRLRKLKDVNLRRHLVDLQREDVKLDDDYCTKLISLL